MWYTTMVPTRVIYCPPSIAGATLIYILVWNFVALRKLFVPLHVHEDQIAGLNTLILYITKD